MDHLLFQGFGALEWGLTVAAAAGAAWTIWLAVRYTLRPGEDAPDHVKRLILDDPRPSAPPTRP